MKIFLVAGGTGGHVFPAIALSEELRLRGYNVEFITDERGSKYFSKEDKLHTINLQYHGQSKFRRLKLIFNIYIAIFPMLWLLYKARPRVVIGFGGYQTIPALAASFILNIPIILHEPNSILGKANKFFLKFAKMLTVSYDAINHDKAVIVGPLVRENIRDLIKKERPSNIFRIFIFGGSQGAQIFSKIIPEAIVQLKSSLPELTLHVTQQVTLKDKAYVENIYTKSNIAYELGEFFPNMAEIYSNTDLVIARSGASTVAELSITAIPAILIPYPHAAEDHQYHNARALETQGGAICIKQSDLTVDLIKDILQNILGYREVLENMTQKLHNIKADGVKVFADTVEKIIK